MSILQRSVSELRGVGAQLAARLAKLHIKTLQDILLHLPYKYVDRTRIYPLNTVRVDDTVVIEAIIEKVTVIPKPKRNLVVKVCDASCGAATSAEIKFFHFNFSQQEQLKPGKKIRCFGQARYGRNGIQFIHPEYRVIDPGTILPVEEYLTPIYSVVEGVSQKLIRNLVQQALTLLQPIQPSLDLLPAEVIRELQFPPFIDSLQQIHFPTPECYTKVLNDGFHPAQRRFAFEELLVQHLSLRQKRSKQRQELAYSITGSDQLAQQLLARLPFSLTDAQKNVIATIKLDLAQTIPMLRLVQGDVGCGKTLVAVMAAIAAIESGLQVAFMTPTEILAEQHYRNIKQWCDPLGITVVSLTGKLSNSVKVNIQKQIQQNAVQLVVGTHALVQANVHFNKLGLVIIDEQHRFGVSQRFALHSKGVQAQRCAHQLILTATPIPRTLAMTFYADLDYSVIDELPPGRKPITTLVVNMDRRAEILQRISDLCATGQQVYWVCTLIEESELIDSTPAEKLCQELQQALPHLAIALVHGKLKSEVKEQIMQDFTQGEINLLVATTVIEVGVDVPNASLMVIENPERLGLAQLHQLRGRVGRGHAQSYCVLLYKRPLGQRALARLQFMRDSQDGFALAEFDLKLRGPGEVFGTKQSGLGNLQIADIMRDKDLLPTVNKVAEQMLTAYPASVPLLLQRWLREAVEYSVV